MDRYSQGDGIMTEQANSDTDDTYGAEILTDRGLPPATARVLIVAFCVIACTLGFVKLADSVLDGETRHLDERILRALRHPDDPAMPIGPAWLREAGMDITALGSPSVLILMILAVMGLMRITGKYRELIMTAVTTASGFGFSTLLKYVLNRDRPTVVPHLREVSTPSFPSGHAMVSAIVFMTLGILLMSVVEGRRAKIYCLTWAMILTFLVGLSRIYLGVHYPTDVLAGWLAGIGWALGCWGSLWFMTRFRQARRTNVSPGQGGSEPNS